MFQDVFNTVVEIVQESRYTCQFEGGQIGAQPILGKFRQDPFDLFKLSFSVFSGRSLRLSQSNRTKPHEFQ